MTVDFYKYRFRKRWVSCSVWDKWQLHSLTVVKEVNKHSLFISWHDWTRNQIKNLLTLLNHELRSHKFPSFLIGWLCIAIMYNGTELRPVLKKRRSLFNLYPSVPVPETVSPQISVPCIVSNPGLCIDNSHSFVSDNELWNNTSFFRSFFRFWPDYCEKNGNCSNTSKTGKNLSTDETVVTLTDYSFITKILWVIP